MIAITWWIITLSPKWPFPFLWMMIHRTADCRANIVAERPLPTQVYAAIYKAGCKGCTLKVCECTRIGNLLVKRWKNIGIYLFTRKALVYISPWEVTITVSFWFDPWTFVFVRTGANLIVCYFQVFACAKLQQSTSLLSTSNRTVSQRKGLGLCLNHQYVDKSQDITITRVHRWIGDL